MYINLTRFLAIVRSTTRYIFGLRLPLAIAGVLWLMLQIPQVRELGRSEMVQEVPVRFGLAITGALIYLLTFREVFVNPKVQIYFGPPSDAQPVVKTLCWLFLGVLGAAGLLFNVVLWGRGLQTGVEWIDGKRALLLICANVVLMCALFLFTLDRAHEPRLVRSVSLERRETVTLLLGIAIFGALTFVIFQYGPAFARLVGPLSLFFVFLSLLLVLLAPLEFWLNKLNIPAYTALLVAGLASTYLSYGGDHLIRRLDAGPGLNELKSGTDPIGKVFADWLSCREDFAAYFERKEPYPVFIVAAEGGGSYAAIHTNAVLSKLQTENPKFASHTFLVSTVSGGTIGAAAFSAAMSLTEQPKPPSSCTYLEKRYADLESRSAAGSKLPVSEALTAARDLVNEDHLAPIVGAALFPNFLQHIFPRAAPVFDRARWLEFGIEESWQNAVRRRLRGEEPGPNVFANDFFTFWNPRDHYPGLVVNAVIADNGNPVIFSPFAQLEMRNSNRYALGAGQVLLQSARTYFRYSEPAARSLRLSTAIGISARFPYAFGPATLAMPDSEKELPSQSSGSRKQVSKNIRHFIDGGYYDSSGINVGGLVFAHLEDVRTTVNEKLAPQAAHRLFDVYLITIGAHSKTSETSANTIFPSLSFPIVSLNNTRAARGRNTNAAMLLSGIPHVDFVLAPDGAQFPLGLYVSSATAERIEKRVGQGDKCSSITADEVFNRDRADVIVDLNTEVSVTNFNACSLRLVQMLLKSENVQSVATP